MRLFALVLFLLNLGALADETWLQVQRELRARKYYFGPVDGRRSPESKAAVTEFQRAKGLDADGEPGDETLRALGLRSDAASAEARAQKSGREWLASYCAACESGDWAREEPFYAEHLRYYSEGELGRDDLRVQREKFYALWPARRMTPLVSYASWNPHRTGELWVSARVRHEVKNRAGERRVFTEELLFILRAGGGGWRLVEAREWPLAPPKSLPERASPAEGR